VARYAGEEFVWVMVGREVADAANRAEAFRIAIESRVITFEQHAISVTVSAGVAQIDTTIVTPDEFIRRADRKLYEAKCAGRNCVRW
jgi:diguanylate cyclase (GGDEF)-like protein